MEQQLAMEKIISVSDRLSYDDNAILGKGTAGFVFRGSFGDDIPVAVKRVKLASMQKEAVQKREEEMFASLDHPNVIKLYHIEEDLTFKYCFVAFIVYNNTNLLLVVPTGILLWNSVQPLSINAVWPIEILENTKDSYLLITKFSYNWPTD